MRFVFVAPEFAGSLFESIFLLRFGSSTVSAGHESPQWLTNSFLQTKPDASHSKNNAAQADIFYYAHSQPKIVHCLMSF